MWLLHGKYARLDDAFLDVLKWEASPVERQSLQQKGNKRRKKRPKRNEKPKDVGHFLV